jgi:hypothetical protein
VTIDAVLIKTDWYKGGNYHHEPDRDNTANPPELRKFKFALASGTNERPKANKNTRNMRYSNEKINILDQIPPPKINTLI